jgi:acetoin utilization deacetylase AcuC-like enzyme
MRSRAALGLASAAVEAADAVPGGERIAYSLCRPPGHHEHTDLAGGSCYLNNAAIAAQIQQQVFIDVPYIPLG